jgi:hypothetical protein
MLVTRNTIKGLSGSWGSGLATLVFQDGSSIFCENGATVRALDGATDGAFITPGHTFDNDAIDGLDVLYWEDEFGLVLGGFALYDDWESAGLPTLATGESQEIDLSDYEAPEDEG